MSSDQGKNTELEQQAPTTEKQKIESTELTDKDLDKVAGGIIIVGSETLITTGGVNRRSVTVEPYDMIQTPTKGHKY